MLDSSLQTSTWGESILNSLYHFYQAFEKKDEDQNYLADYDENWVVSYHEAIIYRSLNYNHSFTPISFDHDDNPETDMIEIVDNRGLKDMSNTG